MDQDRIDAIKAIADRIADYVLNQDNRLFAQLFRARDQYEFRLHLLRAAQKASVPFFGLDEFVEAFFTTTDQDMLKFDWQLARDLMIVRVMEVLYQQGRVSIAQSAVVEEAAEASE